MVYDGKGWGMKLALAQIDMRLGDIEGICGRIEDQARLAHERGARVLCVPAPLFMGAMPGGLVGAADFEHDVLAGLTGVAERIQELDMICIVPAAVSFEGQPLLDYMMLKDGHVVPARSSIALQRGENNDTRWAPPVFDVDGVRIAVIFDLDRELEMLPTGVDLIAYFQFNAFDMTDRETAAIAAVRSGAYRKIASKRSVWFACMAPVGAYDESVYTGGSFVLDDCGRVVAQAPCFEESLLVQEIQRGVMLDALEDHELPEFRSEEWLWQALVLAVRDNARAHGASRAVVTLEGDLPSSLLAALAVCGIGILFSILIVLGVDIYRKHTYTSVILPDAYRITDMKAKEHTSYSVNGDNTDYVYIITVKYEIDGTSYTDTLQILQGTHFATELHARYLADNAPEEVLGNLYYSEKDPSHIGRYGDDSLFVE